MIHCNKINSYTIHARLAFYFIVINKIQLIILLYLYLVWQYNIYKHYYNRIVYIITSSSVCLNITENTLYNMLYITLHNFIHLNAHI